jgi:N-acyl-D-aspartate/D-glutamate deacylase
MTSKAAIRVNVNDRGILRPGMMADITIFDPVTIHDVSTSKIRSTIQSASQCSSTDGV